MKPYTEACLEASWPEANQEYLVAEFARLRHRLGSRTEALAEEIATQARETFLPPPAIEQLSEIFALSDFEREILLLCAGVEMDSRLAALCGEATGSSHHLRITFGLALAALAGAHWSALTPERPLRRFRLLEMEPGHELTSARLRIDERILHYLAGVNVLDPRIASTLKLSAAPQWIAASHRTVASKISGILEDQPPRTTAIHLCGDDPAGQQDVASAVAQAAGQSLFVLRMEDLPPPGPDFDLFAILWQREALLLPGALLVRCGAAAISSSALRLVERLEGLVCLSSGEPLRLDRALLKFDIDKPEPLEQKRLWQQALGPASQRLSGTLDNLAEQFRLSAQTIFSISARVAGANDASVPEDLWSVCRSQARPRLESLAQRVVPSARWDDLVLPPVQKQMLRQLAAQVRHRMTVYETWGFNTRGPRGLGLTALFPAKAAPARPWPLRSWPTNSASISTASTCRSWSASTLAKPKRTCAKSSIPPKRAAFFCSSTRPTRSSANAAKSRTATTATPTSRWVICCSAWRPIRVLPSSPPT